MNILFVVCGEGLGHASRSTNWQTISKGAGKTASLPHTGKHIPLFRNKPTAKFMRSPARLRWKVPADISVSERP